jgi:hypothetical protein
MQKRGLGVRDWELESEKVQSSRLQVPERKIPFKKLAAKVEGLSSL